jgi:rSAM/selenodomain-associated transferase 2
LSISIIIPVLNEESDIGPCLDNLAQNTSEILVVDGGSTDKTLEEAEKRDVKIIVAAPGRGSQQHAGALQAEETTLLFLHCDTRLPDNFSAEIQSILQKKNTAAGAFRLNIHATGKGYRIVEWGVNLRSRVCQLPYGDQALFMKQETYFTAGGFPAEPILEDVALVSRLKQLGKITIADSAAITSARRWQKHGIIKTLVINQLMLVGRMLGISSERLARWYYGKNL